MLKFYLSYLRAFRKYANEQLNHANSYSQLGAYAIRLTEKANQLLRRALLNIQINIVKLQKKMFEAGSIYIKKYSFKFRKRENTHPSGEEYYFKENDPLRKKADHAVQSTRD